MTEAIPINYVYNKGSFFFISDVKSKHRITTAAIIANGVQDLCFRKDMTIHKISKTKPDDIYYIPKGDILWLNIDPPFKGNISILQDIGDDPENMKRFVISLSNRGTNIFQGENYEMYGGDKYER